MGRSCQITGFYCGAILGGFSRFRGASTSFGPINDINQFACRRRQNQSRDQHK